METIWKFALHPGPQEIQMPQGAVPLSVALQGGQPMMWCRVRADAPLKTRQVHTVGTGWDESVNPTWTFVGTFQTGPFVFHVFAER